MGAIADGIGGALSRRLLFAMILAATVFPGAVRAAEDRPATGIAPVARDGDHRLGDGTGPAGRGFDAGAARAIPARQLRVGGLLRTVHAPPPFAALPGTVVPPLPRWNGWRAAGTEAHRGPAPRGLACVRAPPGFTG